MKKSVFCLLILVLSAISVSSQTNLSGTVTDSSGAFVSNADVKLLNTFQNPIRSTKTKETGEFRFENVPAGSFTIIASRRDFSPKREAINIASGQSITLKIVLEINQLSEHVTVTAETGSVESKIKIPQQINIVSQESISQRTTAVLAQVADEETGVSLQRTSPTIGAVLVRGLTEVGVYVDGVRFTNSTQRGGINTFFNLNEPTGLRSVEVQRSPNTAQYGSDGLGGNVQLVSRQPEFGFDSPQLNGEFNSSFNSADLSYGSNLLLSYGAKRFGVLTNFVGRRINTLRPGGGIDSHSAITRFLGLPSNITGSDRLTDTGFTQYGGTIQLNYAPKDDQQFSFKYQRSQQDGGKRYDQLIGGDGNLVAELKNLMLDFGYIRFFKHGAGFFDNLTANVSFNSQREERVNQGGQGNPFASITHDKERTTSVGFAFFLDKRLKRNNLLIGGDYYFDKVSAPSFNTNPANGSVTVVRPRVPNGATYRLGGVYFQDVFEAIPERLRISGAIRFNVGAYRSKSANAPIVNGIPLFPDDDLLVSDFSGRLGAVFTASKGLNLAFNYSRGFRAPNITNLGSLGLVGVGFQVSTADILGQNATIGTTADASAISSGTPVSQLRSEISNNYDASIRFRNRKFEVNFTGFVVDYDNTIVRQTLILPQGAVGLALGSQVISSQNPNGAVFVPLSTSPVLIQANFGNSQLKGTEFDYAYRLHDDWTIAGNHSYVYAEDKLTGDIPNLGGGGIPPQFGLLRLRYQPPANRFWVEGFVNFAGKQSRLSSLDLADRRTGGSRSRSQIQNFFQRGACVRGLTTPGITGQCSSVGGILIATGETLLQVQNRLLPFGAMVNGVLVSDNSSSIPLFTAIPGYALVNLRGGIKLSDKHDLNVALENILDKSHRAPGWGIDGAGRSLTVQYRYKF